jgi:hypothetical protein
VEAGDYVASLNHPLDEDSQTFLREISPSIVREVCSRLISRSLTRKPGSFGRVLMTDYEKLRDSLEAKDMPTAFLRDVPVLEVCRHFAGDFAVLFRGGLETLSGPDPIPMEDLADFFSDPFADEVWKMNARDRKIVGWSRFGKTLVQVSRKALRERDLGNPYSPRVLTSNSPLGTSPMVQLGSLDWVF